MSNAAHVLKSVFSRRDYKVTPEMFVSKQLFLHIGAAVVGRWKKGTDVLEHVRTQSLQSCVMTSKCLKMSWALRS